MEEIRKRRRHVLDAERHRRRHPYPAARRRRLRQCLGLDRLRIGQDLRRAHRQHTAGFGQRQAARGAMEQALAEAALQPRNGLGDGRLGEIELDGGAGKGAGFGNFGEDRPGFEIGELWHRFWKRCVSSGSIFISAPDPILSTSTSEIARVGGNHMIERRPFENLGGAGYDWLKTKHHFSFADYFDPQRMGWGALRVWNDDEIAPGTGFPPHPHADMEIITYVRQGAITHQDSLGNKGRTEAGDVQVMSAGTGIRHSEYNFEPETTKIFQIWIQPTSRGREAELGRQSRSPSRTAPAGS